MSQRQPSIIPDVDSDANTAIEAVASSNITVVKKKAPIFQRTNNQTQYDGLPSHHTYYLTAAPSLFIGLASTLVDSAVPPSDRNNQIDRFRSQTVLLLATVISQHSQTLSGTTGIDNTTDSAPSITALQILTVWLYIAISLSLLRTSIISALSRRAGGITTARKADGYLRFLVPCAFLSQCTCYVSVPHLERNSDGIYKLETIGIVVFLASLLSVTSVRGLGWRSARRRISSSGIVSFSDIPTVNDGGFGISTNGCSPSERSWYDWTPEAFLSWVSFLDDPSLSSLAIQLGAEGLDGSALDSLTLSDIRSFGIPYGDASRLHGEIERLMMRNGGTSARQKENDRYRRYQATTGDPNQMPEGNYYPDPAIGELLSHRPPIPNSYTYNDIDESGMKKAKEIMTRRFGFELPELKTVNQGEYGPPGGEVITDGANATIFSERPVSDLEPTPMTTNYGQDVATTNEGHDDDPSTTLPPEINEIATRNPHLYNQFLSSLPSQKKPAFTGIDGINLTDKTTHTSTRLESMPSDIEMAAVLFSKRPGGRTAEPPPPPPQPREPFFKRFLPPGDAEKTKKNDGNAPRECDAPADTEVEGDAALDGREDVGLLRRRRKKEYGSVP